MHIQIAHAITGTFECWLSIVTAYVPVTYCDVVAQISRKSL